MSGLRRDVAATQIPDSVVGLWSEHTDHSGLTETNGFGPARLVSSRVRRSPIAPPARQAGGHWFGPSCLELHPRMSAADEARLMSPAVGLVQFALVQRANAHKQVELVA
jgi:hypothetical protein